MKILLLSFFIFLIIAGGKQQIALMQQLTGSIQPSDVYTYILTIPSDNPSQSDLFFIADGQTDDPADVPNIKITRGDDTWWCTFQQKSEICMLLSSQFKPNDTFVIELSCKEQCKYKFYAYSSQEYTFQLGSQLLITFEQDGYQFVLSTLVPTDQKFSQISIVAIVKNPEDISKGFKMVANAGLNAKPPSNEDYQYLAEPIWNDGLGIFFGSSKVKGGDTIKTLIYGPANMILDIQCFFTIDNLRTITLQKHIYDDVIFNQTKTYFLNLTDLTKFDNQTNLEIILQKYSGFPDIMIYPSKILPNDTNYQIEAFADETITKFTLTPIIRKQMNFTTQFYIVVLGLVESTYKLKTRLDNKKYIALENGDISQLQLVDDQIDNFLYTMVVDLTLNEKLDRSFELMLMIFTDVLDFGIKRCHSLEQQDNNINCIYNNSKQIFNDQQPFSEIIGDYRIYGNVAYFNFDYNMKNCYVDKNNIAKCVFQIVCFKPTPDSTISKYMVQFQESSIQRDLVEGVTRRERIKTDQYNYYRFSLPSVNNISEVRFFISVISGDCELVSSNTTRFPRLFDDNVDYSYENQITYNQISTQYFLSVRAFESSYYTISAVVVRGANVSLIKLSQSISESFTINQQNGSLQFYIKFYDITPFRIQTVPTYGTIWFQVYIAQNQRIIPNKNPHLSTKNTLFVNNTDYKEFIVIVYASGSSADFTISYRREQNCIISGLSKPLMRQLVQNVQQCFLFHLNKLQDLEIIMSNPSYQLTLDEINITRKINGTSAEIVNRQTKISKAQLKNFCPNFLVGNEGSYNSSTNDCVLQLRFNSSNFNIITLAVQYQNDQIYLLDGLKQKVKTNLSQTKSKHLYYQIMDYETITILIRSKTNTKYKINARIVQWGYYMTNSENDVYPTYVESAKDYSTVTSNMGITALIIPEDDLLNQFGNAILISVFCESQTEVEVNFKISVTQLLSTITLNETSFGYIEKDSLMRYEFYSDTAQDLIVKTNSVINECFKLNIYSRNQYEVMNNTQILSTNKSYAILQNSGKTKFYIAQIQGKSSCFYEITVTSVNKKFYELFIGSTIDIEIKQNQDAYFMYYNDKNQSFRIVSMSDYGEIIFYALTFKQNQLNLLELFIEGDYSNTIYDFGKPTRKGALQVNSADPSFCFNCYYVIKVIAVVDTSTTILIHSSSVAIPAIQDKIIQDSLNIGQQLNYIYYSFNKFNISLHVLYGSVVIEVIKYGSYTVLSKITVDNMKMFDIIPPNGQNQTNPNYLYDTLNQYIIKIKSSELSEANYIMTIQNQYSSKKIKQGVPFSFQLMKNYELCVEFQYIYSNKSIFLLAEMTNTTVLNYQVSCKPQESSTQVPSNLIIKQTSNDENINLQLIGLKGTYRFCMKSSINLNISLLLATKELQYLKVNSLSLISTNEVTPLYYSIYNPTKSSILIQVFQCQSNIQLFASENYTELLLNNTDLILQHTLIAGHYIVTAETFKTGLYYIVASAFNFVNTSEYIIKYSFYDNENPYKRMIAVDGLDISYELLDDMIRFTTNKIEEAKNINIVGITYRIFISQNKYSLKAATQCETASIYNKSIMYASSNSTPATIQFKIPYGDIQKIFDQNEYFYINVVCSIEVIPDYSHNNDYYRIIYNPIKISSIAAAIAKEDPGLKVRVILFWIIIPSIFGLITFGLAAHFCIKRIYTRENRELIEQEDNSKEGQSGAVSSTFKEVEVDVTKKPEV